jgi:succinate dehydrogenase/fumarate reductase flavoprotein subunit
MAAIAAEALPVSILMLTKGQWGRSGATVTGAADFSVDSCTLHEEFGFPDTSGEDSPDLFARDTVRGGKFLNNQNLVRIMVEQAPDRLRKLKAWGAQFSGRVIHPPGHTFPRGVYFRGPAFVQVIRKRTLAGPRLAVQSNTVVLDLLRDDDRVIGALAWDMEAGTLLAIEAKAIVLATGGGMAVYKHSTAPAELTGDGFAMAARAGASLVDMEMPMFFPGLLAWPPALRKVQVPYHLASSGRIYGHMYNKRGQRFMERWDPQRMEQATRDILAVAMYSEMLAGNAGPHGGVFVSIKHLPDDLIDMILDWDPGGSFKRYGFGKTYFDMRSYLPDLKRCSLEAVAACHFTNGGVVIDESCRTEVPGLFAAGEVTGGVHGGNRLSGNAYTDFFVFGAIAGEQAARWAAEQPQRRLPRALLDEVAAPYARIYARTTGANAFAMRKRLQELAWEKIGIVRTRERIEQALQEAQELRAEIDAEVGVSTRTLVMNQELLAAVEARSLALNVEMIAASALARPESRGSHYVSEHPKTDFANWTKNVRVQRTGDTIQVQVLPIVEAGIRPPTGLVPYGQTEA